MGTIGAQVGHMGGAAHGDWRTPLARFGLAAKGALYISLGILALQFVYGRASAEETSTSGAVEQVARQPFGKWLLVLLTVGLAALTLWNAVRAATGDPVEGSEGKDRAKYAIDAVLYGAVTVTAIGILASNWGEDATTSGGSGGGSGGQSQEQATAVVLDWPAGQWLVGLAGLAIIAFGAMTVWEHAVKRSFLRRLDLAEMSPGTETAVEGSGRIGYGARGTVIAIIGTLFVVAAVQHDADEAGGISDALATLADETWGQVLLWVIAVGLVAFGLFALAESRYRRAG